MDDKASPVAGEPGAESADSASGPLASEELARRAEFDAAWEWFWTPPPSRRREEVEKEELSLTPPVMIWFWPDPALGEVGPSGSDALLLKEPAQPLPWWDSPLYGICTPPRNFAVSPYLLSLPRLQ